jgi:hypothetical protein
MDYLYFNGELAASTNEVPTLNTTVSTLLVGAQPMVGGNGANLGNGRAFELDDLIFYNRELTEAEIRTLARN